MKIYSPLAAKAILASGCLALFTSVDARAGDIFLTGHDVLLHAGQHGFDGVILDYLRGSTAKADYNVGVVGTVNSGSALFTGQSFVDNIPNVGHEGSISLTGTLSGYGSATFYDAALLAADANRASVLAGLDALVVLSHTSCGGCSLTDAGSTALNSMAADIASAFNEGMDIWGNSGASLATYYDFLPPGSTTSAASISGSSGFTATAAGLGIGIESDMINGHPTHNRFSGYSDVFTVMETRSTEIISLGLKDGVIEDDVIVRPPTNKVPDSASTALLLGLGLPAIAFLRRRLTR